MSTIYDILKDYPTVNNSIELLNSDILILPNKKKDGSFGKYQPLELANLNKDLKIKCYCDGKLYTRFEASADSLLDIGCIVVKSLSCIVSFLRISDYIKKYHQDNKIKITIVHGNLYNNCKISVFEGNGSDISRKVLNLEDNYK